MKLDPILFKASRLARSRKYEAALRTLEPEVNRYHRSFNYYYLLGSTCIRAGDFGGALTYFRAAYESKKNEPLAILGLAALYLNRREIDRAVDYYLDVLDIDPNNRVAKRALKVIRKQSGTDAFSAWLDSGKLASLYPPIPFPGFLLREKIAGCGIMLVVCALAFGLLIRFKVVANPFSPRGTRQGIAGFALTGEDRQNPLQTGGSYRYILTRVQALDTYEKALALFTAYRDEAARVNINRILESNASEGLKNKARIIISYMEPPGFDSFRRSDNVDYPEAARDPLLYRDVHVIWQGMATNIVTLGSTTTFDFLVGYDTRKTLEGIVPVVFHQAVAINPERPLEVLGRIIPVEGPIQLEGLAIHQSSRLEQ